MCIPVVPASGLRDGESKEVLGSVSLDKIARFQVSEHLAQGSKGDSWCLVLIFTCALIGTRAHTFMYMQQTQIHTHTHTTI